MRGKRHIYGTGSDAAEVCSNRLLNDRGLKIAAYTPELLGYPYNLADSYKEIREASLEYYRKNLWIAAELAASVVLISPGWGMWDQPYEEAFMCSVESLGKLAEMTEEFGIMLALEHLTPQSSNLLNSADAVCRMVEMVGHPNLGAALDLGQMSVFGETVDTYFNRLGSRIQIVHMMDGSLDGHLAFGDGILPLQEYFNELERAEYAGGGQLRKAERVIRESGIKIIAMYPEAESYPFNLASSEEEIRRRTKDYYSLCIEFCDEMRIPAIVIHPGSCLLDQNPNEAFRYGAEGISLLAGLAAGKGIIPILLHGASNYAKGCRGTAELLNAADHTALKAELDLAQLLKDQETAGDAVRYFGGKMGLARISDGPGGHLAVGDGVWPLKEVCGQLFDSGYSGPVALQFDSRNYVADPRTALFSCMKEIWSW